MNYIDIFLEALSAEKGRSQKTLTAYESDLTHASEIIGDLLNATDEDIQKYVIGLYGDFTQYSLLSTLPMKSSYSFRIYELLKSYAFTKTHTFDIDDLKNKLGASGYVNFKDFRIKVLEVATKEINEYTDLEIMWEPVKKGKKVIQIHFDIKQRDSWGQYLNIRKANEEIDGQMNLMDFKTNDNKFIITKG